MSNKEIVFRLNRDNAQFRSGMPEYVCPCGEVLISCVGEGGKYDKCPSCNAKLDWSFVERG